MNIDLGNLLGNPWIIVAALAAAMAIFPQFKGFLSGIFYAILPPPPPKQAAIPAAVPTPLVSTLEIQSMDPPLDACVTLLREAARRGDREAASGLITVMQRMGYAEIKKPSLDPAAPAAGGSK